MGNTTGLFYAINQRKQMKKYKVEIELELLDEADGCDWIHLDIQESLVNNEMITSFKVTREENESTD